MASHTPPLNTSGAVPPPGADSRDRSDSLWTLIHRFDVGAWARAWVRRRPVEIILALGIIARLGQYLADRPPWLDENSLASNILGKTGPELFGALDHGQLAPVGFLVLERFAARTLGGSMASLRLIPLVGGIAALFLALAAARRVLEPRAVVVALALLAVSDDLIYFASELKPYSTDVALGLVSLGIGLSIGPRPLSARRLVGVAAAGAAIVWFSFPAAFALAGVGAVLMASALVERRGSRVASLTVIGLTWGASILACRAVALRQLGGGRPAMEAFWGFAFLPFPPRTLHELAWAPRRCLYLFVNPLNFETPLGAVPSALPAAGLFLMGSISLWRRSPRHFGMLALPGLFALAASACHAYPFHGRMVLFLVPALLMTIAEGCEWVRRRFGPTAWALALATVLLFPALTVLGHLVEPRVRQGFNPHGDLRPASLEPERFPY